MIEHRKAKMDAMKNLIGYLHQEQGARLKSKSPKFKITEKPDATETPASSKDDEDEEDKKRLKEMYENLKD